MSSSPNLPLRVGKMGLVDAATLKELKVKVGAWVTKGQVIAIVVKKDGLARIKAEATGKVVKLCKTITEEVDETSVLCMISAECSHPTLMKDMCAECGADLRQDDGGRGGTTAEANKASIAMVHSIPELRVNSAEAQTLGKEDEVRLRKHKKLVLLVDLDQTLIHTTNENIEPNIKDVYHFQLYGQQSPWYHTRIRPYTMQFMEKISKLYELHICTFGARLYAHTIAEFLDPKSKYFSHRILSRDECFDIRSKTANLSSLFPCGDHMVCIIDDREDVWKFAPNLVHVKPYNFFKNTGDINAPPGLPLSPSTEQDRNNDDDQVRSSNKGAKEKKEEEEKKADDDRQVSEDLNLSDDDDEDSDAEEEKGERKKENQDDKSVAKEALDDDLVEVEDSDDYLLYLEEILKTIHTAYYDLYEQMKEAGKGDEYPDLKTVIPYVKRKTLQGTNIVFSGVVPTHVPLKKSRAFMVARSLGANVTEKICLGHSTDKTTHLIAARLGTAKVNEAKRAGDIRIVTPDWLWCCAERWEKIEESLFPLSKQVSVTLKPPAHLTLSPDIAFAERCANLEFATGSSSSDQKNLPEVNNPMLSFSSDELKGMGDEIDDILSEESSSSSSDEEKKATFPPRDENNGSSSEDSMTAEEPKGWAKEKKRQKVEDNNSDDEEDDDDDDDDDEDLASMAEELEREFMDENSNSNID